MKYILVDAGNSFIKCLIFDDQKTNLINLNNSNNFFTFSTLEQNKFINFIAKYNLDIIFSSVHDQTTKNITKIATTKQLKLWNILDVLANYYFLKNKKVNQIPDIGTDLICYLYAANEIYQKDCYIFVSGTTNIFMLIKNRVVENIFFAPGYDSLLLQTSTNADLLKPYQNQLTTPLSSEINTLNAIKQGCYNMVIGFFQNCYELQNENLPIYLTGNFATKMKINLKFKYTDLKLKMIFESILHLYRNNHFKVKASHS